MYPTASGFSALIQAWAAEHPRPMPWKGIKNPYFIWLSEIILQQTRVEQGRPYYEKFIDAYPTVSDLAEAPEYEVLKLWEGLGYYSRARNLHAAAQTVARQYQGRFPDTYEGIRSLKGVGEYTAAAIASFAYNLPYAVLDGNVFRILSRWFGIATPIDTTEGKRRFAQLAQAVLDPVQPGAHNQAMMDFGATWCTPQNPRCADCPVQSLCVAYRENSVDQLPVKSKKMVKKDRYFLYFVFKKGDQTWLRQRAAKDIWQNLYEFPQTEPEQLPEQAPEALRLLKASGYPTPASAKVQLSKTYRQTLTHRQVAALFALVEIQDPHWKPSPEWIPAPWSNTLPEVAMPKVIAGFWKEKALFFQQPNLFS